MKTRMKSSYSKTTKRSVSSVNQVLSQFQHNVKYLRKCLSVQYSGTYYWILLAVPANIYLFIVSNKNTRKRCEIYWKLTIKKPKRRQWRPSGVFIVNFEYILHLFHLFLLLTFSGSFFAGLTHISQFSVDKQECTTHGCSQKSHKNQRWKALQQQLMAFHH